MPPAENIADAATPEAMLHAAEEYIVATEALLRQESAPDFSGFDAIMAAIHGRILAFAPEEVRRCAAPLEALRHRLAGLEEALRAAQRDVAGELNRLHARQRAARAYRKDKP